MSLFDSAAAGFKEILSSHSYNSIFPFFNKKRLLRVCVLVAFKAMSTPREKVFFANYLGSLSTCQPKPLQQQFFSPEQCLVWWCRPSHMCSKSPKNKILEPSCWPLGPWGTPNESQGSSKMCSKIFSHKVYISCIKYILWFIGWKMDFI